MNERHGIRAPGTAEQQLGPGGKQLLLPHQAIQFVSGLIQLAHIRSLGFSQKDIFFCAPALSSSFFKAALTTQILEACHPKRRGLCAAGWRAGIQFFGRELGRSVLTKAQVHLWWVSQGSEHVIPAQAVIQGSSGGSPVIPAQAGIQFFYSINRASFILRLGLIRILKDLDPRLRGDDVISSQARKNSS